MTTVAQQEALEKPSIRTAYFAEFRFNSGTQYLSSVNFPISWGSLHSADSRRQYGIQFTDSTANNLAIATPTGLSNGAMSVEMIVMRMVDGDYFALAHNWVTNGWLFGITSAETLMFGIGDAGGAQHSAISNVVCPIGVPTHIVGTYDGATVRLYVNGVLQTITSALVTATINTAASIVLGWRANIAGEKARADNIRYYNRALTAQECGEHYRGIYLDESGLKIHLAADEGTGTSVADLSGTGNNGALIGSPTWVNDLYSDRSLRLDTTASVDINEYADKSLALLDGTGRSRRISYYESSEKRAMLEAPWQINVLTKASSVSHADWTKENGIVVIENYAVGPNGYTMSADRIQTIGGGNLCRYYQTKTQFAGKNACFSLWMKSNTGVNQSIQFYIREVSFGTTYATGSVVVTPEWKQFFITAFIPTSSTSIMALVYDSSGTAVWDISVDRHLLNYGTTPGDYVETDTIAADIPDASVPYEVQYEWIGLGTVGGVDPVEESDSLDAKSLNFTLNVAQLPFLALAVGDVEDYRGLPAVLYFCPLDENFRLVGTPEVCWRGIMDTVSVGIEGEEGKIVLRCESRAYGFRRSSSLRVNAAQQKKRYPTDTGLDYIVDLVANPQLWLSKKFQATGA